MLPEPITISAFAIGVLGNYVASRLEDSQSALADTIRERAKRGKLPPNHHVEIACRDSLRQALRMLAQSMDLHIAKPKTLREAFDNRRDARGKWKPFIKWWQTEDLMWLRAFLDMIEDDDALNRFDFVDTDSSQNLLLAARSNPTAKPGLTELFHGAVLDWTRDNIQTGHPPAFFAEWVRDGWPIADDAANTNLTVYQAWCLFFQDHLKEDQTVHRILNAEWIGQIDAKLDATRFDPDGLRNWLGDELGEQRQLLFSIKEHTGQLLSRFARTHETVEQLMPLMIRFADEAGDRFDGIRVQLTEHGSVLAKIDETTQKTCHGVEHLQMGQAEIIKRLAELSQPTVVLTPDSTSEIFEPLIAESKLLDSDGAARFKKLIGRQSEKALLTRSWNNAATNILAFVAWGGVGKTSLVTDWLADMLGRNWPGVDAFFDWSFYSQGTRDQAAANSADFFDKALRFFGESDFADSPASASEKADRLADRLIERRALIVLDGVEPLQHPKRPGLEEGRFKDLGVERLLRRLAKATDFEGLCIVTTRVRLFDLNRYLNTTVKQIQLGHLSVRHAAELLHMCGATRAGGARIDPDDDALCDAARDARGHALTLTLLGNYLKHAHSGDIQKRDRIDWSAAEATEQEGHALRVMAAYENWFKENGETGLQQLAALRLLGLFDRPASAACLGALRDPPIPGLTDTLAPLNEAGWRTTLNELEKHQLLSIELDGSELDAIDAHPLVREYFARQMRTEAPEAWRLGHERLYRYLCDSAEHQPDDLAGLQPLYQAISHGCSAGLYEDALKRVFHDRIRRGSGPEGHFSVKQLGAVSSDLGAIACFFDETWLNPSQSLHEVNRMWVLGVSGSCLGALNRLTEAIEPLHRALDICISLESWENAATVASNLTLLKLSQGEVIDALDLASQSVEFADKSELPFDMQVCRVLRASALFQNGRDADARNLFEKAERMHHVENSIPIALYSRQAFLYCEFLLSTSLRTAWRSLITGCTQALSEKVFAEVIRRGTFALTISTHCGLVLDIANDHLTIARAMLYRLIGAGATLTESEESQINTHIAASVDGLHKAGHAKELPLGLLMRAWFRFVTGDEAGCRDDLETIEELAERGPMPPYLAEVYLYRARLFRDPAELDRAEELISELQAKGFHRLDDQLQDAIDALR